MSTGFFSWSEQSCNDLFKRECGYKISASHQKDWISVIRSGKGLKFIVQAQAEDFVGTIVDICAAEAGTVVAGHFLGVLVIVGPEVSHIDAPCLCEVDSGAKA